MGMLEHISSRLNIITHCFIQSSLLIQIQESHVAHLTEEYYSGRKITFHSLLRAKL